MAVATHVSRVAKEYAPYGYSIMEGVSTRLITAASATVDANAKRIVIMVDDAEIYIEKVQVVSEGTITANDANYITFSLVSFDSGAAAETVHASETTELVGTGGTGNMVTDGFYDVPVTTPVVPSGRVVALSAVKSQADNAGINSKPFYVLVRYRRKA
tara:strand:+ start:239 stop:712 length:474 start_codon:yes stop_codon:yes gene_type:complete